MTKSTIVVHTEKEVVERDVQVPYVRLELTALEASALLAILNNVGGTPSGARGVMDGIQSAVKQQVAGVGGVNPVGDWERGEYDMEELFTGNDSLYFSTGSREALEKEIDNAHRGDC